MTETRPGPDAIPRHIPVSRPRERTLSARLWSGALWTAFANLASRGTLMLSMALAAAILGAERYGEAGIVLSTVTLFESVASLGMGLTATKHIAEYRRTAPARIGGVVALTQLSTLATGLGLGALAYAIAPWLAAGPLEKPGLAGALRIGAGVLALNVISGGNNGVLAGFERFKTLARINALTGFVTPFLVAGGAYWAGVEGMLAGLAGVALLNPLLGGGAVRRCLKVEGLAWDIRAARKQLGLLWRFGLPAMLGGILVAPVNWLLGTWLIQRHGYAEMGLYAAANQWFSILLFLPGVVTVAFLPVLSGQGGEARGRGWLVWRGVAVALWVAVPLAAAVGWAAPWIMAAYGPGYADAHPLLWVVAATAAVVSTQNMLGNALASLDLMWPHFAANLLWAGVNLWAADRLLDLGHAGMALCLAALIAYAAKLAVSLALVAIKLKRCPA